MNLERLKDFFKPEEIEFRIGATNADKTKGIALPYITQRAVQNRLDEVCGAGNWRNEFKPWKEHSQLCGISIRIGDEWITKWDGADDSKKEATKGGLSDSMKRAAIQWGIGRYLYDIPVLWAEIKEKGKTKKGEPVYAFITTPCLPKEFIPEGTENKGYQAEVITEDDRKFAELVSNENDSITKEQTEVLTEIIISNKLNVEKVKSYYRLNAIEDMTQGQFDNYINMLKEKMPNFKMPNKKSHVSVSESEKQELEQLNSMLGVK